MTLSLACSNSAMVTERLPLRAAISAASLTRLARSAPEKPGVPRAMMRGSTSEASGTLRICTFRIFSRPTTSGLGTTTWRSKRPGRSSAGIEHVGPVGRGDQDDAFIGLEAVHLDQQLIEGLLALVVAAAEAGAAMTADRVDLVDEDDAGRVLLALLEHVAHARLAPTPTNISTKSEPEMVKNGTLASPAMARASRVLPVPGGPTSSTPFGILPPRRWNFCGSFRYSTISSSSCLASSMPATSSKVMRPDLLGQQPRAALAEAHGAAAAALHLAHEENPHADQQQHREPGDQDAEQRGHVVVDWARRGCVTPLSSSRPTRFGSFGT